MSLLLGILIENNTDAGLARTLDRDTEALSPTVSVFNATTRCHLGPWHMDEQLLNQTGNGSFTFFTTLAGAPIATENAGISLVTTELAPIVQHRPMLTPGKIVTFPPIQQSSPIVTSLAYSISFLRDSTSVSCVAPKILTKGPNITRSPIVTRLQSRITRLENRVSPFLPLTYKSSRTCFSRSHLKFE
jgi:hypothetical protein